MSKIIYKDIEEIESIKRNVNNYCAILNENMKRVLEVNKHLNYKVCFYHTFVNRFGSNRAKLLSKIDNYLNEILNKENPFNTPEFVKAFGSEINAKLHNNKTYKPDGDWDIKEGVNGNIKTIGESKLHFCKELIMWDGNKFVPNDLAINEIENQETFKTRNKLQEKVMDLLNTIDNNLKELDKLGYNDFIIFGGPDGFNFARYYANIQRLE